MIFKDSKIGISNEKNKDIQIDRKRNVRRLFKMFIKINNLSELIFLR